MLAMPWSVRHHSALYLTLLVLALPACGVWRNWHSYVQICNSSIFAAMSTPACVKFVTAKPMRPCWLQPALVDLASYDELGRCR